MERGLALSLPPIPMRLAVPHDVDCARGAGRAVQHNRLDELACLKSARKSALRKRHLWRHC
jgi:hypothetical protein